MNVNVILAGRVLIVIGRLMSVTATLVKMEAHAMMEIMAILAVVPAGLEVSIVKMNYLVSCASVPNLSEVIVIVKMAIFAIVPVGLEGLIVKMNCLASCASARNCLKQLLLWKIRGTIHDCEFQSSLFSSHVDFFACMW